MRMISWCQNLRLWFGGLSRATVLVFLGVLLAALVGVLRLFDAPLWCSLIALLAVAAVGILSEVDKSRTKRSEKERSDLEEARLVSQQQDEWLRGVYASLKVWPLSAADEVDLGSRMPGTDAGIARRTVSTAAKYVERDIDKEALQILRKHRMLLLIGAPSSGVTRTAYELAKANEPDRLLLAPLPPTGLKRAVLDLDVLSRVDQTNKLIIILDRLDQFNRGGLSLQILRQCRLKSPGIHFIATISSSRYAEWVADEPDLAEAFGQPLVLERLLSVDEQIRADAAYPDVTFSEGIAAAFTVNRSLLQRLRTGDNNCPFEPRDGDCALARSVVGIAIEWANTGTTQGIEASQLAELSAVRLRTPDLPGGPEHFAHCLEWSAAPVKEGASILHLQLDGVGNTLIYADAGVAQIRDSENVLPGSAVWSASLAAAQISADYDAMGSIGYRAHTRGLSAIAAAAWAGLTNAEGSGTRWIDRAASFSRGMHRPADEILPLRTKLELVESTNGTTNENVAEVLTELGTAWAKLGNRSRAQSLFDRAMRTSEASDSGDRRQVVRTLDGYAAAWRMLGEPARARELFEKELQIHKSENGAEDVEFARTLNNLGAVYSELGEPEKAREMFERALRIQREEYGPEHFEVASTLNNLGNVWGQLGDPAKAVMLFESALPILEEEYGSDSQEIAPTLANLATAFRDLGKPAKSMPLFERALTLQQNEFGREDPEVAGYLNSLSTACLELGDSERARDLGERALRIQEQTFGRDHPKVALTLVNLGSAWTQLGKPERGRDLIQRALKIQERTYGRSNPEIVPALNNLGNAWKRIGNTDQARRSYERGIAILRAHFPSGHPRLPDLIDNLRRVVPDGVVMDSGAAVEFLAPGELDRLERGLRGSQPDAS